MHSDMSIRTTIRIEPTAELLIGEFERREAEHDQSAEQRRDDDGVERARPSSAQ